MKNFQKALFTLFAVIIILFSACSKKSSYSEYYSEADWDHYDANDDEIAAMPAADFKTSSLAGRSRQAVNDESYNKGNTSDLLAEQNALQNRKLVKRANLQLRADDLAATEEPLSVLLEKYSAWLASSGINENYRNYTIRVPSASYEKMLAELSALGKILRRNESAEDVTMQYYDLESRLGTKRELIKTYQSYLNKAKNIEEIMTVERYIAELQQDIDRTGSQFKNLSSSIDYSTINIEIYGPTTASSGYERTIKDKMSDLFSAFKKTASGTLVFFTGFVIFGIPAVLICVFLFWILFGRIGLLKKLFKLAAGKKN